MLLLRQSLFDEVFLSVRELDDGNSTYNYYEFSICAETGSDYIVAVLGIPCIVIGLIITIIFFVSSSLHRSLLMPTDIFVHSFLVANCLNFVTKASSVIEFMINECWHAGMFACKFSIWSSEFTATAAIGFLVLAVVDVYHPRIHRFMLRNIRRYIAVGTVVVVSVFITTPDFLLVGLKEFGGNTLCTFTSNSPNHYMLLLKKDLFVEYIIPILVTSCIVMHGQWTCRDAINLTADRASRAPNERVVSIQTVVALPSTGANENNDDRDDERWATRKNRHAMILALSFLLLKLPHNYIILLYVYDMPPRSLEFQAVMDYFELAACLVYAGSAPLLVLVSSKTHREKFRETLHILKSFVSGRPWQPGFEMDMRNDLQS